MKEFVVKGLRLPPDLYAMILNECKRQEAYTGFWPGVYPVILDALYSHFDLVEDSYNMEVLK